MSIRWTVPRLSPRASLAICVVALLAALLPLPASVVERVYSQAVYPALQRWLTPLSSLVPFALLDLVLVFGVGGLVAMWVRLLGREARGRRWRRFWMLAARTVVVAASVYLVFMLTWGLNYRRQPLTTRLDFDPARITTEGLGRLSRRAVTELNRLYPRAEAGGWPELAQLPRVLGPAFQTTQHHLGVRFPAVVGRPKRTLLSFYFQRSAIDGMINPLLLEVLINDDVLPFERAAVTAHEWAHLAGYADESEASFVGWLACLQGEAWARYSAWLMIHSHAVPHLPREAQEAAWAELAPGPRDHLRAIAERLRRSTPAVRVAARRIYDRFLKANRVPGGVESYGRAVTLLLGTRFERRWIPASRGVAE